MLKVDLSTLRGPELRQLLDSARQRGQASLSYEILQEMAARRETGGRSRGRGGAEGRTVAVDLGEPLDRRDPADWPVTEDAADPALDETDLRLDPPARPQPARPRTAWGAVVVALVFGLGAGGAAGWWGNGHLREQQLVAQAEAPHLTVTPEPPAPPPAPAPTPAPVVEAATAPPAAAPAVEEPAPQAVAEAAPAPAPSPAPAADAVPADTADCAAQATPADRAICGDPRLQRLQRELRQAYARALAAHQDRILLRSRQLAWRDARDAVGDPDRLADLYAARIRRLDAATAAAEEGQR